MEFPWKKPVKNLEKAEVRACYFKKWRYELHPNHHREGWLGN
jgi:hypothetical protein